MRVSKKILTAVTCTFLFTATSIIFTGCGDDANQAAMQTPATPVKTMMVLRRDTPESSDYAGQVVATSEVKVQSKIAGNIMEKYVTGGQVVSVNQPLFKIDSRNYESALLQAQANLYQSEVNLNNAQIDFDRYRQLYSEGAISEQTITTQAATVRAYDAQRAANEALVQTAQQNLQDTLIVAPMSGKLGVDDVAIGTYVTPGSTNLVTIGSNDPVYVQFSIVESEYLNFIQNDAISNNSIDVTLTLSDGTKYSEVGRIVGLDRALGDNTGTLTVKALFRNPDGLLLPGMFARVTLSGRVVPNAMLVPQRAVQQLLDKSFVMVVGDGNKSVAKTVELGNRVGSYFIVKNGLRASDMVVVEGLTSLREGMDLNVTMVTPKEMGFSLEDNTTLYNADADTLNAANNQNQDQTQSTDQTTNPVENNSEGTLQPESQNQNSERENL